MQTPEKQVQTHKHFTRNIQLLWKAQKELQMLNMKKR